jgi:hypothetical protein
VCLLLCASNALAEDVVDLAATLIGRPYVWGAEGPTSFDCSGLTQYVYQQFGVELPRRAIDQSRFGDSTGRRLQRGDLLFFSTDPGGSLVTHVALYEGNDMLIEASKRSGRVRRDSLDDPYLADRYMFARHVDDWTGTPEISDRGDAGSGEPGRRSNDKRRAAVRVLERVAGELFKIPRR